MMYSKSGESKMAKTYGEHLALKKKGWGHSKPKKKKGKGLFPPKYFIGALISGVKGAKDAKKQEAQAEAERQAMLAKEEQVRASRQKLTMSPEIEKMKEGLGGTEINRRQEAAERSRAGAMAAATRGGTRVDPFAAAKAGAAQESALASEQSAAQRKGLEAGVAERGRLRATQESREQADLARAAQMSDYAREDVMAAQANKAAYQQQQYGAIDAGIGTVFGGFAREGSLVKSKKKGSLKDRMRSKAVPEKKDFIEGEEPEVTPGKFSHKENPIDLVQKNGEDGAEKIGEMTGGEAIVPPKNVKQIRKMINSDDGDALVDLMDRLLTKWDREAEQNQESKEVFDKTKKAREGSMVRSRAARHQGVRKPRLPIGKDKFKKRRTSLFD